VKPEAWEVNRSVFNLPGPSKAFQHLPGPSGAYRGPAEDLPLLTHAKDAKDAKENLALPKAAALDYSPLRKEVSVRTFAVFAVFA